MSKVQQEQEHTTQHDSHAENPDGHNEDDEAVQSGEAKSKIRDGKDSTNRISEEFDFDEFYKLASRVLNGDTTNMATLNSFKDRWEQKFKIRKNPLVAVPNPNPTNFIPVAGRRASLLPRRTVITGLDTLPMSDLAVPNQDDGGVSRLVLEEQGCSSHLPSVLRLVAVQEKLPEKVTAPNNFEISSQLEGDVVNNQDAGRKVHYSISDSTQLSKTVQEELPEQPKIFIGTMKLISDPVDNIAGAFLNSSRKTLHFVPPTKQNGEIVIRPSKEVVEQGSKKWQATAVDYFLGKRPYFPHLESFVRSNWKGLQTVSATSSGFYFFRFQTRMAMEVVIEGGPWLFQGQPIVLQFWEHGMSLRQQKHIKIPVWIRLKHLPMEYWTDEGLSTVASGIGTPLYTDGITKDCSRLDFARFVSCWTITLLYRDTL
ncbi:UNVERIFIED_CONTAM: hypothetical protein Sangu_2385400 [Sesamum angustifolium]|uniref:DUF4283 domain-containing protein n=1 Tax=Sesamum angustifolium TaxID=2727405 RepID=A0AAW2KV93_9LAMI